MGRFLSRPRGHCLSLLLFATSALAGCQQNQASLEQIDTMSTASTAPASFQQTARLGKAWQADPGDIGKGIAYANGLQALGQVEQQMSVLKQLVERNPNNAKLAILYGKKLAQTGNAAAALPILERAAARPGADWRLHSALGSTYDQQGLYEKAQAEYNTALALQPNELSVLNNMGMSHALQGNLQQAETTLRQASLLPKASTQPRLRQNLALVVGLQGRFEEARKIASEDLPPSQVDANMAYLQKMLSQPNTWQQLAKSEPG